VHSQSNVRAKLVQPPRVLEKFERVCEMKEVTFSSFFCDISGKKLQTEGGFICDVLQNGTYKVECNK
jgi:hypothetical protein